MGNVSKFNILGEDINVRDNRVNEMHNDVYLTELVVLGDSYSTGYLSGGGYARENIPTVVSRLLHLNLHNYGVNASGFTIDGNSFQMQALNAIHDTSYDHSKVKYVLIIGGINDVMHSTHKDDVHSYAENLYNMLGAEFVNCKIVYAPCWTSIRMFSGNEKIFKDASNIDEANNCSVVSLYKNLTTLMGHVDLMGSDNVHPTEAGYYMIASNIVAMLNGGFINRSKDVELVGNAAWDISNLSIIRSEDNIHVSGFAKALKEITLNDLKICTIKNGCCFAHSVPERTVRFLASVWNQQNQEGKQIKALITSTFDIPTGYEDGDIYMFHDYGNTINAGDDVYIELLLPILNY